MFKNKLLKTSLFGLMAAIFVLLGGLVGEARAASVTTAPDVSISVDNVGGSFTAIGNIIITEDAAGEIAIGDHIFTLPSEWEFATTTDTISVSVTGNGLSVTSTTVTATNQSFTITTDALSVGSADTLTISNVEVRPTVTSSGTSHEIFHDSGSADIAGITNDSTSFGTVTTIPGSVTQLAITTEPTATVYGSTISAIDVVTQDQFGNLSTSGLAATEDVTAIVSSGTGTLSGTTAINIGTGGGNGSISFTDLTLDAVDSYTLQVDSTSYTADTTSSFDITQKELTISGSFDVSDKTYDGTTHATISTNGLSLVGTVGEDAVNLIDIVLDFDNENVGTDKIVSIVSANINDTNYSLSLTSAPTTSANISQAPLTVTAPEITKVYDGTTDVPETSSNLSGLQDDDVAGNIATLTFDDKNVGANKSVTPSGLVIHNNTGDTTDITSNYNITYTPNTASSITQKELTVTGATAADKVYDGTLAATTTGATLSGVVSGDDVYMTATTTGEFASAGVSNGIAVTSNTSLAGTDASNYSITQQSGMTANITAKPLDITGATATSRAYDGTTVATITGATLDGIVGEDDVYLTSSSTGTFVQATPGSDINVTTAMGLAGDNAGNYSIALQPTLSADIYTKTLHVTGGVAQDKVYDGDDIADIWSWVAATTTDVIEGDEVFVIDCVGYFERYTVGNNLEVSISCTKDGAHESYYTISAPDSSASITPKMLTVAGASVTTKNYDGNTDATITGATLEGVVSRSLYSEGTPDTVSLGNHTSGTFSTKYPGTNIPVATAMTISGEDVGNYTLTQPTLTGTIRSTSGGGGGSSITFCTAVSYGEWGECTGGFQYRDVLTKTPTACSLTTEQQLGAQRLCTSIDDSSYDESNENEDNNDNEEGSDDSSSDVDVIGVMNRERNKVLNVNRVLSNRMAGRILLQVEENGEAWYVDPKSTNKYFMGRPADAFQLMRNFGLGISEANYNNFSTSGVPSRFAGQILLRVEKNGEAYYVNPDTLEMNYLGRPADAFRIMRELALGISNDNLRQIQVGE